MTDEKLQAIKARAEASAKYLAESAAPVAILEGVSMEESCADILALVAEVEQLRAALYDAEYELESWEATQ